MNDSVQTQLIHFIKTVEFRQYRGKLYLNYINHKEIIAFSHRKTQALLRTTEFLQDISVNEIQLKPASIMPNHLLNNKVSPEDQVTEYDPSFWAHYNIIKEVSGQREIHWEKN